MFLRVMPNGPTFIFRGCFVSVDMSGLANQWWTGQLGALGLPGIEPAASSSPMLKKRDREILNNNENSGYGRDDGEEEREKEEGAIEVGTRRPRGRPPGSKNKPKPPIIVTRDSPNALQSHVMEVASGADIVESIAQFARRLQRGVCVLSGSGAVANVTLRQPATPAATVALHGRFEILSLTGAFLPGPALSASSGLTVYLADGPGQVLGGSVVGTLVAVGPVLVIAVAFANATFERLPLDDVAGGVESAPPAIRQQHHGLLDPLLPVYNLPPNIRPIGGQMNHEAYAWAHACPPY
ncbi:hypothetical protein HHK36_020511 [Tetracentron sinense]|uniref:PPC domain-containing protein n=1 Tax=Tetracentron sinense TaxID=13715 RepID=A0A834YRU5_TETSI|nr:hypothetical protein HHK36_020511 [Tetracentron sinense]